MTFSKITNIWNSVKHLLLSQYNDSPNLNKLIEIAVNGFQGIEDGADKLSKVLDLENASGSWLDIVGKIKNISRANGESDSDYRERLEIEFEVYDAGTPDNVIRNVVKLSNDPTPIYHEEVDAVFFVYTPNGSQLLRSQVRKFAPAGVLGLPGAALKFVDIDKPILTGLDKKILTVARDATRGT